MSQPVSDAEFEAMVADAIDELPKQFRDVIEKVAVVISDLGQDHHAYGMYYGDGMSRDNFEDRIVIYRDTLTRDFGHDHNLLASQVERTVRQELGHHIGFREDGVRDLGL
ncbi:MAG: metallopeptidase family protein [Solirubrobacterales bacterium]|nr:metallopeptidase family protein [Solirubrobacterales bacterium]